MSDFKWRYVDDLNRPCFIEESDICIYAREHHPGGYSISDSNQLIFNFKKPMRYRGSNHWHYKEEAIIKFSKEIGVLKLPEDAVLIPVPPSKPRGHSEYDDRIEKSLMHLKRRFSDFNVLPILNTTQVIPSAHEDDGPRNPRDIIPYLEMVDSPVVSSKYAFLVDDVITTGGHFKACQQLLQQNYPAVTFVGLFWAIHVFPEDEC